MPEIAEKKRTFIQRFWWVFVVLVTYILATWSSMPFVDHTVDKDANSGGAENNQGDQGNGNMGKGAYPACPADLAGILTAPLMDPAVISAMIPLGNVSPPGHTYPVDHIYFVVNTDDPVPLYAPADGWITHIMANSEKKTTDSEYEFESFVVTYTICDGLVLDFAGYNDVVQPIKDELAKLTGQCKSGIVKTGHDAAAEQQCDYPDLKIPVTANELIGYTQRAFRADGYGYNIPFEIWAADYNQPARSDVDWSYYNDNRYAHAICTFDLYSGVLKDAYDAKFGTWSDGVTKSPDGKVTVGEGSFIPRTIEPLCGEIVQDIAGTLQGAWFSGKPDLNDKSGNVGNAGYGITIIHNNIDPGVGEVVIGGEFGTGLIGVIAFAPTHAGTVNREPSEVKADGQVYCYSSDVNGINVGPPIRGKVLIRLIDDHHMEAAYQDGTCGTEETISEGFSFTR